MSAAVLERAGVRAEEFRAAMAALAAPVTVVTCYDGFGTARGLTASAVSSLSLDPPLFLVCLDKGSSSHDALAGADAFCVNLLGPGDEALAMKFAGRPDRRFDGVPLAGSARAPELADVALRLVCEHHEAVDAGDHTILIGRVTAVEGAGTDGAGPAPAPAPAGGLVWHQRGFAHARPAARPAD
ncbi:flavin reductase family protein [Streptomyces sp. ICC1]|uniref:flavin reductase family protein n=1 Tax=Streptomyces sp. ICC1 TaxID=2099583 RepID=UPI001EF9B121|nr:flavin reductase family protein [Streptomyces sp. ICC1]